MMASKKQLVDSYEKRLDINRTHMKREAKKATKSEKNLKVQLELFLELSKIMNTFRLKPVDIELVPMNCSKTTNRLQMILNSRNATWMFSSTFIFSDILIAFIKYIF